MEPRIARASRLGAGLLVLVCTCLLVPSGGSLTNVNAQGREGGFGRSSTIPLDPDSDRVGATAAEFRVDESGAATYSIPLYTVPGTAGVTPQISLNYSSQGGGGPLGKGWSIGGLSSISRCRATREAGDFITAGVPHDGAPKPILLNGNDRFCLDGQRLIEVSNSPACAGVSGMAVVQLRTEIESFQRVCAYTPTSGNNGAAFFTVERKDGSISWYGDRSGNAGPNRPDGYVNSTAPDRTGVAIAWAQTRFQDSTGNYIDFTYHESSNGMVGEHLLAEVRFTGKVNLAGQGGPTLNPYAKLRFNYELLPTPRHEKGYVAGGLVTRGHRLQSVMSCATIACSVADQARYYRLLYAPSPSGSTLDGLTSIQECRDQGMGVCLDPTVFTWSTAKHEFATSESPTGLPAVGSAFRGYKLADIDGDGRQDLVYLRDGNVNCSTDWLVVGFAKLDSLGRPTWEFMAPRCLPARIRDRGDGAWHLFDYDGDGRDDLMVSAAAGSSWHLYASVGRSGNGFSSTNLLATTPILSQSDAKDQVQIADLNGDGLVDVVYPVGTSLMARMMTRTEGGFRFGLQVPVGVDASSLPPWPDFCAEFGNTCTRTISGIPTNRTNHVQMADFNGDAASDLLVRVGTYMRYRVEGVPGCTPRLIHGQRGAARAQDEDEDIPYVLDMDRVRDDLRRQVPPGNDPCWEVSQSDELHAFTAHNNAGASITLRNHAAVAGGNPAAITFGDSNGDGLTDLFVQEAVNGDWRLSVNTGKSFIIGLILNVPDFRQHARFQDINGDGRTDLLYVVNDSAGRGYRVRFARPGGGFEPIGQMLPGGNRALICGGSGCNADERIPMFADLDGDGALDFTSMRFTSSPLMYVSRAASRFTPRDTIVKVTNGMGAQTQVRYQPMTNVDIHRRASGTRDTTNWGRGSPVTDFIAPMYVVERASSTSPQHGAPDAMATVYYRYANARIQAGGRGFLGFGRIQTIDPNQGSGHVATTTDYAQNFPFVGMPMQTVKRVVAGAFTPGACRNGTITDACFAGPGAHPALGGSTFSNSMQDWEAETDIGSGATVAFAAGVQAPVHVRTTGTVETARDPWAGGVTSTVATAFVYAGYGNVVQTAVDTYTGANTLLSTVTTANTYAQDSVAKWRLGRLTASEVTHARPGTTPVVRKTRFWYDMTGPATGLLLYTRVENPDGYDLRTEYTYDVFGNRTAEATCTDNLANCDLSLLQFKPANIRTVHRYRETRYERIGNGRFPRATWEPFWDASGGDLEPVGMVAARNIFGQPTQVEDENGVVTVAVSGTLGREYFTWQQTEPGGATPANGGVGSWVAHRWCGTTGVSCPTGAVVRTRKFTTGAPLQWTYIDALGRPVMQATQTMNAGVSGKDVSASCTAYDAAGRPVRASVPFFLSGTTGGDGPAGLANVCTAPQRQWVTTTYDMLGRPLAVDSPDPAGTASVTTTYHNLTTGTRDARNNLTNTFRNGAGEVVQVVEASGLSTTYDHDAAGNVVRIRRDGGRGHIDNDFAYDTLGRKIAQDDPDAGYTEFEYNALGELIVQTNADLQKVENEYDARGRVWRRTVRAATGAIETQTTFTFDTANNGLGRLASETITGTYEGWQGQSGVAHAFSRTHTYDDLGRPKTTTTVIDGVSYPGEVIYDAMGRAARVRDATGQWSKTAYDPRGFARAICYSSATDTDPACASPWLTMEESDAWGNVTREVRSWNGQLPVTRTYSALTGRLERICADKPGSGGACDLVDEQYAWDKAGNLHTRQKDTRYLETFRYDTLNRLTHGHASVGGGPQQLTHWAEYDRLGNTCARLSDEIQEGVGFGYAGRAGCGVEIENGSGTTGDVGAHQVNFVHTGPLAGNYLYDNRGNQTLRDVAGTAKDRRIRYSADDRPYEISLGSATAPSQRARFWYGPDGQRYKREDLGGKRTLYLGNVEIVIQGAQTTMRRMIGGTMLQLVVGGTNTNRFLFHDQLGSLVKTTDTLGNVVDSLDYMPNGNRRNVGNPQQPVANSPATTPRGFTGHEHVDGFDVIHMNGRIYDPTLGRFLQPDPVVQAPMGAQGWNAYTYVFNNPLAYTDPSGMISLRQVLGIVIAVVGTYVTAGMDGGFFAKLGMAMAFGAASGYVSTGTMQGALWGAFAAGAFYGIGTFFENAASLNGWAGVETVGNTGLTLSELSLKVLSHGITGGVMSKLQGGKFGHGFASAGATEAFGPGIAKAGNPAGRVIVASIVGGTASKLSGGKFANGALTGAFGHAFNELLHYKQTSDGQMTVESPGERIEFGESEARAIGGFIPGVDLAMCYFGECTPVGWTLAGVGAIPGGGKLAGLGGSGLVVLGHYSSGYIDLAKSIGARYFDVPMKHWSRMTDAQQWSANSRFLDRVIARQDSVVLATPASQARPGSFFARELQYLHSHGYRLSADGTRMVPPPK